MHITSVFDVQRPGNELTITYVTVIRS